MIAAIGSVYAENGMKKDIRHKSLVPFHFLCIRHFILKIVQSQGFPKNSLKSTFLFPFFFLPVPSPPFPLSAKCFHNVGYGLRLKQVVS